MDDKYKELLDRIVKGAEFIASIDPSNELWDQAHERYNDLCDQVRRLRNESRKNDR